MKHPSRSLNNIVLYTSILTLSGSLILPEVMLLIAPFLLFLSVVLIGIPHGAIDHIIAARVYGLKKRLSDYLLFYASYLLVMFLIGLLWLFFPMVGMIFFLLISIYHFGQADMVSLMKHDGLFSTVFAWLRGFMIIGIIIFAHPEISLPIIETAIRKPDFLISIQSYSNELLAFSVLPYLIVLILAPIMTEIQHKRSTLFFESILVISLLIITHPLIGFAVYFALWHSAGHVLEMIEFFKEEGEPLSVSGFYKLATPFTLVSIFGLGILFYLQRAFSFGDEMVSLLFILISVLTLPHMIVVDKMYKKRKAIQPSVNAETSIH